MADVEFRVVHVDHDNTTISIHTPVGGSLRWGYRTTDIGDITYELALSEQSLIDAGADSFAPYATDWRLGMNVENGGWNTIHAGIHTNVGLRPRTGVVSVQGKDWAHWLEQPIWFSFYDTQWSTGDLKSITKKWTTGYKENDVLFNARGYLDNPLVTPVAHIWVGLKGAKQRTVIEDLIAMSKEGTDFVNITPAFEGPSASWDSILSYEILMQDETNILEHIKTLAAMSDPYGYDFAMEWDKTMRFWNPRRETSTVTWTLTSESVVRDSVPDFDWVNNGPLGTYMVGLGAGSPALWYLKFHQPTIDTYRQWLRIVRVADTYATTVRSLADAINQIQRQTIGLKFGFPHKDLKLTVKPDLINPIDKGDGFRNHCGNVVRFQWAIPPYHTIDAFFWITEQEFYGDAAGNYLCDLGLEQIYEYN